MTDDQRGPTDNAEDNDGSTMSKPGGGPKKVVSETSVDDILNSLEEPTQPTAKQPGRTATESAATESKPEPGLDSGQDPNPNPNPNPNLDSDPDPLEDPTSRATAETDSDGEGLTETEEATPKPSPTAHDDEQSLEDAISALEETESADATLTDVLEEADGERNEDLAERIEAGTVTGADVRAAEAGIGREPTPDVDEIELSLDDLEGATSTPPTDTETTTDDEQSAGVLGRLKRLFSG